MDLPACVRFRVEDKSLSELYNSLSKLPVITLLVNHKTGGQTLYVHAPVRFLGELAKRGEPQVLQLFTVAADSVTAAQIYSALQGFGAALWNPHGTVALFLEQNSENPINVTLFLLVDIDFATIDGNIQADTYLAVGFDDMLILQNANFHRALQEFDFLAQASLDFSQKMLFIPVDRSNVETIREKVKALCIHSGFTVHEQHDRILLFQNSLECAPVHAIVDESVRVGGVDGPPALGVLRTLEKLGLQSMVKGTRGIAFSFGTTKCNHCLRRLRADLEDSRLFHGAYMFQDGTGFFVQLATLSEEEAISTIKKILTKLEIPPERVSYHVVSISPSAPCFGPSNIDLLHARLEGNKHHSPIQTVSFPTHTAKFMIQGLTCPNCCVYVESILRHLDSRVVQLAITPSGAGAEALIQYNTQGGEDLCFLSEKLSALGYPATFQHYQEDNQQLLSQLAQRDTIFQLRIPLHKGPLNTIPHSLYHDIFPRRRRVFPLLEAKYYELLSSPFGSTNSLSDFENPSTSPGSENFPEVLYEAISTTAVHVGVVARKRQSTDLPGFSRLQNVPITLTVYRSRLAGDTSDWGSEVPMRPLGRGLSHASLSSMGPSMSYDSLDNFPTSASVSSIDELPIPIHPRRVCASQEFHLLVHAADQQTLGSLPVVEEAPLCYIPLEWTLWFDITFDIKAENRTKEEAQALLQKVGSFSTLQGFWSYWSNLNIPFLKDGCNIKLFKKGIRPLWDDGANKDGGRWMARAIPKQQRFKIWTELVLTMICQWPGSEVWDSVCGLLLSTKPSGDVIELWVEGSHGARQTPSPTASTEPSLAQTIAASLKAIVFPDNDNKVFHYQSHLSYIAYKKNKRGGKRKKKSRTTKGRDGESDPGSGEEAEEQPAAASPTDARTVAVAIRRNTSRDVLFPASPTHSKGAMSRNTSCQSLDDELLPHHQEVKLWLERHNLIEYFDTLISNGYDDMRAVRDLDEGELDDLGFKRGHKKRLLQEIGKLPGKQTPPVSPYGALNAPLLPDGGVSSLTALLNAAREHELLSASPKPGSSPIPIEGMRGMSVGDHLTLPRSAPKPWSHDSRSYRQQVPIGVGSVARPPRVASFDNLEPSRIVGFGPTSRSVPQHAPSQWNTLSTLPRPMSAEDLGLP